MSCRVTTVLAIAMGVCLAPNPSLASDAATANALLWNDAVVEALIQEGLAHNSDGDFDAASEVWERLAEVAPQHPGANVHAADTLIWLQLFEDDDTSLDESIQHQSEEGVRKAQAWVDARPGDAHAHMYLGQTLMTLGRLHGIRGRLYRAGSFADKARNASLQALELDPSLSDAKYPLGLYAYYASLVPDLFKWLDFLWFIPKGDAALGLQYLEEVGQTGDLYQFTAAFYLSNIHSFHERSLDRPAALATLESLHRQHPKNSLIHFELLETLMLAERYEEALREALVLESHPGTGTHDRGRADMARVWRARAELYLGRPDEAWRVLEKFADDGPVAPAWGNRWVHLTRGQIKDAGGQRGEAIAEYERITVLELDPAFSRATVLAEEGLEQPFRTRPQISAREPRGSEPVSKPGS